VDGQEEHFGGGDPDVERAEGRARVHLASSQSSLPFELRATANCGRVTRQTRGHRGRRVRLHSRTADEATATGHALHPSAIFGLRPRDSDKRVPDLRELSDSVDGNDPDGGGRGRAGRIPQHPHRTFCISQHARRNCEPHVAVKQPPSHLMELNRICILILILLFLSFNTFYMPLFAMCF
jgi:hypothetical protein